MSEAPPCRSLDRQERPEKQPNLEVDHQLIVASQQLIKDRENR